MGDLYNTGYTLLESKEPRYLSSQRRTYRSPETLDWLHIQHEASRFSCVFTHSVSKFSAKTLKKSLCTSAWALETSDAPYVMAQEVYFVSGNICSISMW